MRLLVCLLCLAGRGALDTHAVRHFFISRKTRSNSPPVNGGHVYIHNNNEPLHFAVFNGERTDSTKENGDRDVPNVEVKTAKTIESTKTMAKKNAGNRSLPIYLKYNDTITKVQRNNASENLNFAASNMNSYYVQFNTDSEDVRTDSKNSYDNWPFFYHGLLEYEPLKMDAEAEKAKDKRFVVPKIEIIPVHEKVVEEIPSSEINFTRNLKATKTIVTTDNPIFGNQPFLSYVLNDYFEKTDEEDPMTFKDLSWGKEFDHDMALQDIDNYAKRIRRLEENDPNKNGELKSDTFLGHDAIHESSNSKGRELESSEKRDDNKYTYDGSYKYNGENYRGFKDFVDSFANRFGSEDHENDAKYFIKNNEDKGKKRKGFRKTYHKDEYQEHEDFFDNTDISKNLEDKGSSKVRVGGSEAFLRSQAAAALGNDLQQINNAEENDRTQHEKHHTEKQRHNDSKLYQYRDVAKNAALSNSADYIDRYAT